MKYEYVYEDDRNDNEDEALLFNSIGFNWSTPEIDLGFEWTDKY